MWGEVKKILGHKRTLSGPSRITVDIVPHEGAASVAEVLCEFFTSIGHRGIKDVKGTDASAGSYLQHGPLYNQFIPTHISPAEVLNTGKSIRGDPKGWLEEAPSEIWKQHIGTSVSLL